MTLLVFGKTGQVATELARLAPDAVFLDRAQADQTDPAACVAQIAAHAPAAVINAAAWTAVDRAEEQEAEATRINGATPAALAAECAARDIPFVHISTDYVFPGDGETPWKTTDPVAPPNAYGRSKLAGEDGVRAAGGRFAVLRTSWVFSAHGGNFVKTMLRLSETRDALTVVGDQIGGPTPAADIARACLTIADVLKTRPETAGTYHFSGAWVVSGEGCARETFALSGRAVTVTDIPTADYPTPATRPLNSRMDCSATEAAFGVARPDWRAGLRAVLAELGALR
jgi:dTDP-4-dehydrorhamnose reductase